MHVRTSTTGSTALLNAVHELGLQGRAHCTSKSRPHFRFIRDSGLCMSSATGSHPRLIKANGLWFFINKMSSELQQLRSKYVPCSAACALVWLPVGVAIFCRRMGRFHYFLRCFRRTQEASRSPLEWETGQKQNTQLLLLGCFCIANAKYVLFCRRRWVKPQWSYCQPSLILFVL